MRGLCLAVLGLAAFGSTVRALASPPAGGSSHPGRGAVTARQCVERALDAVRGARALLSTSNERLDGAAHTPLTERSYRPAPFITASDRIQTRLDVRKGVLSQTLRDLWPESDPDNPITR